MEIHLERTKVSLFLLSTFHLPEARVEQLKRFISSHDDDLSGDWTRHRSLDATIVRGRIVLNDGVDDPKIISMFMNRIELSVMKMNININIKIFLWIEPMIKSFMFAALFRSSLYWISIQFWAREGHGGIIMFRKLCRWSKRQESEMEWLGEKESGAWKGWRHWKNTAKHNIMSEILKKYLKWMIKRMNIKKALFTNHWRRRMNEKTLLGNETRRISGSLKQNFSLHFLISLSHKTKPLWNEWCENESIKWIDINFQ